MVKLAEIAGVGFNLAYTFMYLNGQLPQAYLFAGGGAVMLGYACWHRALQAETALHGFYLIMAMYGAWIFQTQDWSLESAGWLAHLTSLAIGLGLWQAAVPWLRKRGSAMPSLDAFTTVFSVIATWWMIQGDPIHWLYWMAIDTLSIFLYVKRGLPWAALLFFVYALMAIDGWFDGISWFTG